MNVFRMTKGTRSSSPLGGQGSSFGSDGDSAPWPRLLQAALGVEEPQEVLRECERPPATHFVSGGSVLSSATSDNASNGGPNGGGVRRGAGSSGAGKAGAGQGGAGKAGATVGPPPSHGQRLPASVRPVVGDGGKCRPHGKVR